MKRSTSTDPNTFTHIEKLGAPGWNPPSYAPGQTVLMGRGPQTGQRLTVLWHKGSRIRVRNEKGVEFTAYRYDLRHPPKAEV